MTKRSLREFLLVCLCGAFAAAAGQTRDAAEPSSGPAILHDESGLSWSQPAQPWRYFDVLGRRAGVFGMQDGKYEAWIYPIKILHGYRLEFRLPSMVESIRGEALLQRVITRPESTTLVYVHPNFTVRQTIWTPVDQAAILTFFQVDSDQPLTITAKFVPDFKPMWPAGLGGQHTNWVEEDRAYLLTDGTGKPTAVIGTPAPTAFSDFLDHSLIRGEMLLQFKSSPEQARRNYYLMAMSLSLEGPQAALSIYRDVTRRASALYQERVQKERAFLRDSMQFRTPDVEINRAWDWAKVTLHQGWVCSERHGCGLIAGYGPAGTGERPGFAWWFGGDGLMSTWALEDYGDLAGALQELRFLKSWQRDDGKIIHEIPQSVDLVNWFGNYSFAYMHADTTPMYLYSLGEYWRRTGDRKVLEEFWASAQKAYAYCISTLAGDGLMDNTKAGLAAVEVGVLRGKVTKDIYLEGFWLAGAQSMAQMAAAMADTRLAADARARAGKAAASLAADWWNADGDFFAFGITDEGKRADLLGVWPAVLLSLTADIPPGKRESATQVLARPELATDWGIRSISNQSPLYDPVSYNNGTAWPFMGAFAAWAQYRQNQTLAGFHTWSSIAHLTGIMAPGAVPEHMVGNRNEPGERAVPRQLFSSLGVLLPATRGLLGLEPDAPAHKIRFAPRLPADWPSATFSRLRVGDLELGGEIGQEKGLASITLSAGGSPSVWQVELSAAIPLGAQVRSVTLNGRPAEYQQSDASDRTLVTLAFALAPHTQVLVHYDGGIAIVPPPVHPQPGDSAATLRIVSVALDRGRRELRLGLAGLGGHTYQLELLTGLPAVRVQGGTIQSTPTGYTLELSFPESTDYATQDVQIHY